MLPQKIRTRLVRSESRVALIIIAISLTIAAIYTVNASLLKPDLRIMVADAVNKNNVVSNNVLRYEKLRELLPARGTVGYLDNSYIDKQGADGGAYFQAQYALAPVLVAGIGIDTKITYPYVVGNFSQPVNLADLSAQLHLEIVRDFGNGIVLFRNTESPH